MKKVIRTIRRGLLRVIDRGLRVLVILAVVFQLGGVPGFFNLFSLRLSVVSAQEVAPTSEATPTENPDAPEEQAPAPEEETTVTAEAVETSDVTETEEVVVEEETPVTEETTAVSGVADVPEEVITDTPLETTTDATVVEPLSEVQGVATVAETAPVADEAEEQPELSTDKNDYHPGETATIFGKLFAPSQRFIVKIFGSDENGKNYTETEEGVTTNQDGGFSLEYLLDSLYRPFYEVVVLTLSGEKVAETWFRDSSVGTYDQCSNDDGDGYASGDTGCRWTQGNIQANNSTYFEGDSTVQRLWIEGYVPGSSHTVTFKYGTTKGGSHAYDYLTTWNASENWATVADRCQDITGCTTASETATAMQNDPNVTDTIEPSAATRNFTIRGATITNVSVPTIVSGTYAGDSETVVTVTFNVGPSNGSMCSTKKVQGQDVTSCGMAVWFGAHVAKGSEWTVFNGTTGAGAIPGSPYHVALDAEDGASIGQRDNQMAAAAIVQNASITIIKDAVPNDAQDFAFTTTGTGLSGFSLDDDANGTLSNTQVFNGLSAGNYTVTEGAVSGWSLTNLVCVDPTTNSTVNLGTRTATIALAAGENITCTYTNTLQQAHLTLLKTVVNDNGGTALDTAWTLSASGPTPMSGIEGNGAVTNAAVNAGAYTLSESAGPSGYSASIYSCVNGGAPVVSNSITLNPGDNATCTITNDDIAPKLHLRKVVTNNNGGTATVADFTLTANGTGANDLSGTSPVDSDTALKADNWALSETGLGGYTGSAWVCDSGTQNGNNITLGLDQEATCTVTNDDQAAHLKLVKVVNNDNGGTAVATDFTLSAAGSTPLSGAGGVESDVNVGSYNLSETSVSGYSASAWTCVGGTQDGASITLGLGQSATCTITNNDNVPKLTLNKVVVHDNGGTATESDWTLFANGLTSISGPGATGTTDVVSGASFDAGTYTLSESTGPVGYTASDWVCVGGNQTGTNITLGLGQEATCTITNNDDAPSLTLIKQVTNDNGGTAVPADFTLTATDYDAQSPDTGTYDLSESGPTGYTQTSLTCDNIQGQVTSVTLGLGEDVTCTFVNNDNAPALHLRKVVVNDNGGTAAVTDFTLTANGTGTNDFSGTSPVDSGAGLLADTFALSETSVSGYSASDWVCVGGNQTGTNITLGLGQEATCTITNNDTAPRLTIIKDATPNDLQDFAFTGTLGAFSLDDDAGVVGEDTILLNSKTFINLKGNTNYTVTETLPNTFWSFGGATCVVTGTATPYAFANVTNGLTVNLGLADNVTCTITNHKVSPTRTLGFWQTHTAYTSSVFTSAPISSNMLIGTAPHKGAITTTGQLFGAFYAPIAKTTTGAKRTPIDQARMQLLQQLVAAKLNCAAFTCATSVQTMITSAGTAYASSDKNAILASAGLLDAYNNSGDTIIIGNAGNATPALSKSTANLVFWNAP